jgi:serine/threonine protein kinase
VIPGERRRYTKRFLNSTDGDFAHWTEREWKILARLIGHGIGCVPDVVQFDRGSAKGPQLVQTYDAGVTVDQWATLLPLYRDGHVYRHAFEDCAHWWALAHYCVKSLKEIHQLQLVHLDIKGDNVCIPFGPATFDPEAEGAPLYPLFGQLALIDFAFSVVSGESLAVPLPIGWQREYDYQSPRLIEALAAGHEGDLTKTRELDWRCDIYSLRRC